MLPSAELPSFRDFVYKLGSNDPLDHLGVCGVLCFLACIHVLACNASCSVCEAQLKTEHALHFQLLQGGLD